MEAKYVDGVPNNAIVGTFAIQEITFLSEHAS